MDRVCEGDLCVWVYYLRPGFRNVAVASVWYRDADEAARQAASGVNLLGGYGAEERARCSDGDQAACVQLARMIERATHLSPNPRLARRLAEAACDAGYQPGCRFLAEIVYLRGIPRAQFNPDRLLTQLCPAEPDCEERTMLLASIHRKKPEMVRPAIPLAEARCADGHVRYCKYVLRHYYGLKLREEAVDAQARQQPVLERACTAGDPRACQVLRSRIPDSDPRQKTLKSRKRAAAKKSCDEGQAGLCVFWAELEIRAGGVVPAELIHRACEAGASSACVRSAEHHFDRGRVELAERQAFRACLLGSERGCSRFEAVSH